MEARVEDGVDRMRWGCVCGLVLAVAGLTAPRAAAEGTFPFGRELILDANPMRGSKRIPILEIAENGTASIDLWCASLRGLATIAAETIAIVPGEPNLAPTNPSQCTPERVRSDEDMLTALSQVTNWRRRGDVVELLGASTLRFRLMTN
jgi:hypothetical protein